MKDYRFSRRELFLLTLFLLALAVFRVEKYLKEWREVEGRPQGPTQPEAIQVLPGFKVSLMHSAETNEGSWISMAVDPEGRVIVSSQEDGRLLRLTISDGKEKNIELIPQPVSSAMGLLYAKNSLFLDCQGPKGWGIYRMRDNGGGFEGPELLCPLHFTEFLHGAHAIVLGPDEKLYVVCGDHTQLPPGLSPASPFQNYAEDQLLPSDPDPTGWDPNAPPEGFVFRMDLDGKNRELLGGGSRNNYSVAFNSDGELFGFDNDHDYDYGLPWYRPTRINHWVSGAEFGSRKGSGKFPEYYEDTLPATLNVGIGGPSGVTFAPSNCAFPPEYKDAFFMADWQYGRILAAHLFPRGASYGATIETVLRGVPLNIAAVAFGPDGTLYFITGGSGMPSALYRVTWTGPIVPPPPKTPGQLAAEKQAGPARHLRHQLEAFQGRRDPGALDLIWPALCGDDRWIRYAARVALESQDLPAWKNRALEETNIYGGLTALLALARCSGPSSQPALFTALQKFPFNRLTEEQQLLKLRVVELSFIRQGRPSASLAAGVIRILAPLYPAAGENINHELCQLLFYLDAPRAITKTLALLDKAPNVEEQIYYVMRLRNITNGWTLPDRKKYLGWFLKDREHSIHRPEILRSFTALGQMYYDGTSFGLYLNNFRKETVSTMSPAERQALAAYLPAVHAAPAGESARKFVKAWRMADLLPRMPSMYKGRHLVDGLHILTVAQCLSCHRFGDKGGSFGPNLTAVGSRMQPQDILESIIKPSKVIEQNFQNTVLTFKDGDELLGRVVGEDQDYLLVITNQLDMTSMTIAKTNIVSRRLSKISPMPEGLLNSFTEAEIWDLIACLKRYQTSPTDK